MNQQKDPIYAIVAYRGNKTKNIFSIEGVPFSRLGKALKREPLWVNEAILEEGYITIIIGTAHSIPECSKLTKRARGAYTQAKGAGTDIELFKMNKLTNNKILKDVHAIKTLTGIRQSQIPSILDNFEEYLPQKSSTMIYSRKDNRFIGDVDGIGDLYRRFGDRIIDGEILNLPTTEIPINSYPKSELTLIYHTNETGE